MAKTLTNLTVRTNGVHKQQTVVHTFVAETLDKLTILINSEAMKQRARIVSADYFRENLQYCAMVVFDIGANEQIYR